MIDTPDSISQPIRPEEQLEKPKRVKKEKPPTRKERDVIAEKEAQAYAEKTERKREEAVPSIFKEPMGGHVKNLADGANFMYSCAQIAYLQAHPEAPNNLEGPSFQAEASVSASILNRKWGLPYSDEKSRQIQQFLGVGDSDIITTSIEEMDSDHPELGEQYISRRTTITAVKATGNKQQTRKITYTTNLDGTMRILFSLDETGGKDRVGVARTIGYVGSEPSKINVVTDNRRVITGSEEEYGTEISLRGGYTHVPGKEPKAHTVIHDGYVKKNGVEVASRVIRASQSDIFGKPDTSIQGVFPAPRATLAK